MTESSHLMLDVDETTPVSNATGLQYTDRDHSRLKYGGADNDTSGPNFTTQNSIAQNKNNL